MTLLPKLVNRAQADSLLLLQYTRELVLLVSVIGTLYLGKVYPGVYAETAKLVLVSTITGYFGQSNGQPLPMQAMQAPALKSKPKATQEADEDDG